MSELDFYVSLQNNKLPVHVVALMPKGGVDDPDTEYEEIVVPPEDVKYVEGDGFYVKDACFFLFSDILASVDDHHGHFLIDLNFETLNQRLKVPSDQKYLPTLDVDNYPDPQKIRDSNNLLWRMEHLIDAYRRHPDPIYKQKALKLVAQYAERAISEA